MFRRVILIPMIIVSLWFIGYLMLSLVYCIPTEKMEKHIQESVSTFAKEGCYPMITDIGISRLDNHTDALMLLTAAYPENENIWTSSLCNKRYSHEGENPVQTLIGAYSEWGRVKTEIELQTEDYPRYWHGYLVLLKPLLYFFDYTQIRYIIMFVQMSLFSLLVSSLSIKKELIFPTIFMWIFLNPIATMCSIQYNTVFLLTLASMIFIVRLDRSWKCAVYKWGIFL